jgi:hypothetical protein
VATHGDPCRAAALELLSRGGDGRHRLGIELRAVQREQHDILLPLRLGDQRRGSDIRSIVGSVALRRGQPGDGAQVRQRQREHAELQHLVHRSSSHANDQPANIAGVHSLQRRDCLGGLVAMPQQGLERDAMRCGCAAFCGSTDIAARLLAACRRDCYASWP